MLKPKILFLIISLWLIWGSTFLATKIAIDTIPPLLMAGFCFFVAGAILLGGSWFVILRINKQRNYRNQKLLNSNDSNGYKHNSLLFICDWKIALIAGATLLLGGQGGITWGEQYLSSGIAALLFSSTPIWMAFIGRIFFSQRLSKKIILGLVIGFSGLMILINPIPYFTARNTDTVVVSYVSYVGILSLVMASISWAVGSLYLSRITTTIRTDTKTTTSIHGIKSYY